MLLPHKPSPRRMHCHPHPGSSVQDMVAAVHIIHNLWKTGHNPV